MGFFDIYKAEFINPEIDIIQVNFNNRLQIIKKGTGLNKLISKSKLSTILCLKKTYKDIQSLIDDINSIDIKQLFKDEVSENKYIECLFFNNCKSWISKNIENKSRYFIQMNNKNIYFLDTLDLIQCIYKIADLKEFLKYIINKYKISFNGDYWVQVQRNKYSRNFRAIHFFDIYKKDYPFLYEVLKPCLKVYETLNVIGETHIIDENLSYNNENLFFSSNKYISSFCNISQGNINKIINLLALLKIINKVNIKNIDKTAYKKSNEILNKNDFNYFKKSSITYFTINDFADVAKFSENIARRLVYFNINHRNITLEKVRDIFGDGIIDKIYFTEYKKKENNTYLDIAIREIIDKINKNKYCSKNLIEEFILKETNNKKKWRAYKDDLLNLCKKENIKFIKPSKELKEQLNLVDNSYIFIK